MEGKGVLFRRAGGVVDGMEAGGERRGGGSAEPYSIILIGYN